MLYDIVHSLRNSKKLTGISDEYKYLPGELKGVMISSMKINFIL